MTLLWGRSFLIPLSYPENLVHNEHVDVVTNIDNKTELSQVSRVDRVGSTWNGNTSTTEANKFTSNFSQHVPYSLPF